MIKIIIKSIFTLMIRKRDFMKKICLLSLFLFVIPVMGMKNEKELFRACIWNSVLLMKQSIENGANLEARDENGWTPLMNVCSDGCLKSAKYLIKQGASLNAEDNDGDTCFDHACLAYGDHLPLIQYLEKCGVNTIVINQKMGGNVLYYMYDYPHYDYDACFKQRTYMNYFLDKGAELHRKGNQQLKTPYECFTLKDKHNLRVGLGIVKK
jgi:hypothetical protein